MYIYDHTSIYYIYIHMCMFLCVKVYIRHKYIFIFMCTIHIYIYTHIHIRIRIRIRIHIHIHVQLHINICVYIHIHDPIMEKETRHQNRLEKLLVTPQNLKPLRSNMQRATCTVWKSMELWISTPKVGMIHDINFESPDRFFLSSSVTDLQKRPPDPAPRSVLQDLNQASSTRRNFQHALLHGGSVKDEICPRFMEDSCMEVAV